MGYAQWLPLGDAETFEVLERREDPRGEEWGFSWQPTGETFVAVALERSVKELFSEGRTSGKPGWTLMADRPLPATRLQQVRSPKTGRLELYDAREVKATDDSVLKGEGGLPWE